MTSDGGKNWRAGVVKGAQSLQFRDVQGVSERIAYLLSIGDTASDFRIYKTEDGGATWSLQFQNQQTNAFYDCFAFWTPTRGVVHSDSVNGVFPDLRIRDGKTWQSISSNMPPALPKEASFASSGTCVATQGDQNAWVATGGSTIARILATKDGGQTWNAYDTPLASSLTGGGFTVAFRDASHGILGGGNLNTLKANSAQVATSRDGGNTWSIAAPPPVTGAIFGLSYLKNTTGFRDRRPVVSDYSRTVVITANTGGTAWTPDEGSTWYALPGVSGYWGVAFANPQAGWMVGEKGTILKISFR
jgi:photosystem II stability/assembly factor-like uncharacterized protein